MQVSYSVFGMTLKIQRPPIFPPFELVIVEKGKNEKRVTVDLYKLAANSTSVTDKGFAYGMTVWFGKKIGTPDGPFFNGEGAEFYVSDLKAEPRQGQVEVGESSPSAFYEAIKAGEKAFVDLLMPAQTPVIPEDERPNSRGMSLAIERAI